MRVAAAGAPSPSPRTTYYVPRTTYHELRTTYPQGGHTGPPLREITHATSHEQRIRATSYKPLATVSSFQPSEPSARASWSRPAKSPSLVESSRNNGDEQRATKTKLRPNPDHWLDPEPQLPLG